MEIKPTRYRNVKKIVRSSKGFTIVELMIATTVFSVVLLVAGTGVIAIGRIYFKNINSTRVQEVTRSITEDVTRSLQFSTGSVTSNFAANPDNVRVRCFGSDRYTYVLNDPAGIDEDSYGLKLDRTPEDGCSIGTVADGTLVADDARQLLGNNMRLLQFDISDNADNTLKIIIRVAYGDDDLLTTYDNGGDPVGWTPPVDGFEEATVAGALCKGGPGSTFCSVGGLETSVARRIE